MLPTCAFSWLDFFFFFGMGIFPCYLDLVVIPVWVTWNCRHIWEPKGVADTRIGWPLGKDLIVPVRRDRAVFMKRF